MGKRSGGCRSGGCRSYEERRRGGGSSGARGGMHSGGIFTRDKTHEEKKQDSKELAALHERRTHLLESKLEIDKEGDKLKEAVAEHKVQKKEVEDSIKEVEKEIKKKNAEDGIFGMFY